MGSVQETRDTQNYSQITQSEVEKNREEEEAKEKERKREGILAYVERRIKRGLEETLEEQLQGWKRESETIIADLCTRCEGLEEELENVRKEVSSLREWKHRQERERQTNITQPEQQQSESAHRGKEAEDERVGRGNEWRKSREPDSSSIRQRQTPNTAISGGEERRQYTRPNLGAKPDAMREREMEYELKERAKRRKNIKISGFRRMGKNFRGEVANTVQEMLGMNINFQSIEPVEGVLLATVGSREEKVNIMRRKAQRFRGTNIWIEDDRTPREREVQEWLHQLAREERAKGRAAKVSYQRIRIQEAEWKWNDGVGNLELVEEEDKRRRFFREKEKSAAGDRA